MRWVEAKRDAFRHGAPVAKHLANEIDLAILTPTIVLPLVRAGSIKVTQ
jgi:hypothetical protein